MEMTIVNGPFQKVGVFEYSSSTIWKFEFLWQRSLYDSMNDFNSTMNFAYD